MTDVARKIKISGVASFSSGFEIKATAKKAIKELKYIFFCKLFVYFH